MELRQKNLPNGKRNYFNVPKAIGLIVLIFIAVAGFTGCKQTTLPNTRAEAENQLIKKFTTAIISDPRSIADLIDPSIGTEAIDMLSSPYLPMQDRQEIAEAMRKARFVERTDTYATYAVQISPNSNSSNMVNGKFWIVTYDGRLVIRLTPPKEQKPSSSI